MPPPEMIKGARREISYIFSGRVLLPLPKKTLMPKRQAVIGGVDDNRVLPQAARIQSANDTNDVVVNFGDGGIIADIAIEQVLLAQRVAAAFVLDPGVWLIRRDMLKGAILITSGLARIVAALHIGRMRGDIADIQKEWLVVGDGIQELDGMVGDQPRLVFG